MAEQKSNDNKKARTRISGYGLGSVDTVLSVDDVARQAEDISNESPPVELLEQLAGNNPLLFIKNLVACYGKIQIIHDFD